MVCNTVREMMDEYIDGYLGPNEAGELEAHLEVCSECRTLYKDLTDMICMVGSLEEVELPGGFHERLHNRLRDEMAAAELSEEDCPMADAVRHLDGDGLKPVSIGSDVPPRKGLKAKLGARWYKWCGAAVAVAALLLSVRLGNNMDLFSKPKGATPPAQALMGEEAADTSVGSPLEQQETKIMDEGYGESVMSEESEGNIGIMMTALPESDMARDEAIDAAGSAEPVDIVESAPEFGTRSAPAGLEAYPLANEIIVYVDPDTAEVPVLLEWAEQYGFQVICELEDGIIYNIADDEQMQLLYELLSELGRVDDSALGLSIDERVGQVTVRIITDGQ
jgi:hypothetical protein